MDTEIYPIDERILRYIRGEMDPKEQASFEGEIDANAQLKEQLEVQLAAQGAIWAFGIAQERKELDALYEEASAEEQQRNRRGTIALYSFVAVAAAIITLMMVFNPFQSTTDPVGLYATHYTREVAPETLSVVIKDSLLRLAHIHFNANTETDLDEAVRLYELLLANEDSVPYEKESEVHHFLGISYLELNQPDRAMEEFKKMTVYTEYADWYIALAYLKKGDADAAKLQLTKIAADPKHYYFTKAKEVLDDF